MNIDLTSCNPSPGSEPPTPPTGCVGVPDGSIACPTKVDVGVPFNVQTTMTTPNVGSSIIGGQVVALDSNGPVTALAFSGPQSSINMTINTPGVFDVEMIVKDNCGDGTQSAPIKCSIEVVGPTYGDSGASGSENRAKQASIVHADI